MAITKVATRTSLAAAVIGVIGVIGASPVAAQSTDPPIELVVIAPPDAPIGGPGFGGGGSGQGREAQLGARSELASKQRKLNEAGGGKLLGGGVGMLCGIDVCTQGQQDYAKSQGWTVPVRRNSTGEVGYVTAAYSQVLTWGTVISDDEARNGPPIEIVVTGSPVAAVGSSLYIIQTNVENALPGAQRDAYNAAKLNLLTRCARAGGDVTNIESRVQYSAPLNGYTNAGPSISLTASITGTCTPAAGKRVTATTGFGSASRLVATGENTSGAQAAAEAEAKQIADVAVTANCQALGGTVTIFAESIITGPATVRLTGNQTSISVAATRGGSCAF